MSQTIARRYARALYTQALAKNVIAEVDADIQVLADALDQSRPLQLFFQSPVINRDKKQNIVQKLFTGKLSPLVSDFLGLLVQKGRESMVSALVQAYQHLRDGQRNTVTAEVRMAYTPDAAETASICQKLEAMTGKTIRAQFKKDERLIGGAVVRVGDTVYDGSVQRQLQTLKERLLHGSPSNN